MDQTISVKNPGERPLWNAVASWIACDAVDRARPDLRRGERDMATQVRGLWEFEWTDAPLLDASGEDGSREQRASALMRMAAAHAGPDRVREGLQAFFKSHAGQPCSIHDLYNAMPGNLPQILHDWTDQAHSPLIESRVVGGTLELEQRPFDIYPDTVKKGGTWHIPLVIRYEDDGGVKTLKTTLSEATARIPLQAEGKVQWAYPDLKGYGLFRTQLPPEELQRLIDGGADRLSADERMGLMANQWRLVRHGSSDIAQFYDLIRATSKSADSSWLSIVSEELGTAKEYLDSRDEPAFDRFTREVLEPVRQRIGLVDPNLPPETLFNDHRTHAQISLTSTLVQAHDPAAREVMSRYAERWLAGDSTVPPTMASATQDPRVFEKLVADVQSNPDNDQQMSNVFALANFTSPPMVDRAIKFFLDGPSLTTEQRAVGLQFLAESSPVARDRLWPAFQARWDKTPGFEVLIRDFSRSSYRGALQDIVARRPSEKAELALHKALTGSGITLATLPQQISKYLNAREEAPIDWHLAPS